MRGEDYSTHVSLCFSSATAASMAAAIFMVRATLAAGLRFKVTPKSLTNISSAAHIASAARSVAVFKGAPLRIVGERRKDAPACHFY
jgi:hypothetical protein